MPQKKNQGVLWQYYWDVSLYNVCVSVLVSLYTGPWWGLLLYVTIGYAIALLCFEYYQGQEYLFYRNCGWSKKDLFIHLGIFNVWVLILLGAFLIALQRFLL